MTNERYKLDMLQAICDKAVVAALALHPANLTIAEQACATLSNLATSDNDYCARDEMKTVVLAAREAHPTSETVTECACVMIGSGSWFVSTIDEASAFAKIAVEAAAAFPRSKRLISSACFALRALAKSKEGAKGVAAAGGAAVLMAGFSMLPQEQWWKESLDEWCAHNVCAGLLALSTIKEGRASTIAAGGVAALAKLASTPSTWETSRIVESAEKALKSYAGGAVGRLTEA